jgi:hypothetical protein
MKQIRIIRRKKAMEKADLQAKLKYDINKRLAKLKGIKTIYKV